MAKTKVVVSKSNGNGAGVSPPSVGAPMPPKGFKPTKKRPGTIPTDQQVRDAGDVAREVTVSGSYDSDFGKRAPTAPAFAAALTLAKAWSNENAAAEAWLIYANEQREKAWVDALTQAKLLQPEFKLADGDDPSIAKRYPQLKDFLGVRRAAALRASATRAAKKKAAKKPS